MTKDEELEHLRKERDRLADLVAKFQAGGCSHYRSEGVHT